MKECKNVEKRIASLIATVIFNVSKQSANGACSSFFYEPEQPKELERLKKNHQ